MNYILTIFIIVISLYAVIERKYKLLIFVAALAFTNDLLEVSLFGPTVNLSFFITAIYIPTIFFEHKKNIKELNNVMIYLYLEIAILFVLAIYFGFFSPWDEGTFYRTWAQSSLGRGFISAVRLALEIMLIPVVYYWIVKGKIKIQDIITIFGIIVILNFGIAVFDFLLDYPIKRNLFMNSRIIASRFTGLCNEPRVFGRGMAIAFIMLYTAYIGKIRVKWHLFYIAIAGISVIISFSASSLIVLLLSLLAMIIVKKQKYLVLTIFAIIFVAFSGYLIVNQFYNHDTSIDQSRVTVRVNRVLYGDLDDRSYGEPEIFTRFEVFDRAALNFLYSNPEYVFFGTGPNLISIPASNYLSYKAMMIFQGGINSVPHSGFVNILARSGIAGIILYLLFFMNLYNEARSRDKKLAMSLIVALSVFFAMINMTFVYFVLGIIFSLIYKEEAYVEHRDTRIKRS